MAKPKVDLTSAIYHDDNAAREHLETLLWPAGPFCPRCGVMGDRITKLQGKSTRPGVYKCKDCRARGKQPNGDGKQIPARSSPVASHLPPVGWSAAGVGRLSL
jgi:hypothetical protein